METSDKSMRLKLVKLKYEKWCENDDRKFIKILTEEVVRKLMCEIDVKYDNEKSKMRMLDEEEKVRKENYRKDLNENGLNLMKKRKRSGGYKYKLNELESDNEKFKLSKHVEKGCEITIRIDEVCKVTTEKKENVKRNPPTRSISPKILKMSEKFEKGEKSENVSENEMKVSKVKLAVNSFEKMMDDTKARRKKYEVKRRVKLRPEKSEKSENEKQVRLFTLRK